MELLELDLGADIDARLQRWQVRRLECTRWCGRRLWHARVYSEAGGIGDGGPDNVVLLSTSA